MNAKVIKDIVDGSGNISQIYSESIYGTGYTTTVTFPFPVKMLIYLLSSQGNYTFMSTPEYTAGLTYSDENTTVLFNAGSAGTRGFNLYVVAFG